MRSGNKLELAHKNFHLKPTSVSSDVSLCTVITIKFNLVQKKTSVNEHQIYTDGLAIKMLESTPKLQLAYQKRNHNSTIQKERKSIPQKPCGKAFLLWRGKQWQITSVDAHISKGV